MRCFFTIEIVCVDYRQVVYVVHIAEVDLPPTEDERPGISGCYAVSGQVSVQGKRRCVVIVCAALSGWLGPGQLVICEENVTFQNWWINKYRFIIINFNFCRWWMKIEKLKLKYDLVLKKTGAKKITIASNVMAGKTRDIFRDIFIEIYLYLYVVEIL